MVWIIRCCVVEEEVIELGLFAETGWCPMLCRWTWCGASVGRCGNVEERAWGGAYTGRGGSMRIVGDVDVEVEIGDW